MLADDGLFIVTTPNEENLAENTVYCPMSNVVFHRWQHVRNWSRETLRETLEKHGFAVQSVKAVTFRDAADASLNPLRKLVRELMTRLRKPQGLMAVSKRKKAAPERAAVKNT